MEIEEQKKLCFGPVPSRRLGRSLGINNIPSKICSYACVYCQLGKTLHNQIHRTPFYDVEDILTSVQIRLDSLKNKNETIDYLAYVPDGEPTLDANLGKEVDRLKQFGIKTAIISNASLIGSAEVRNDLCKFDWVSLKIDAVSEDIWHKIKRPNKELILQEIQQGIITFRSEFSGFFATETMVIKGLLEHHRGLDAIGSPHRNRI
jgi:wyosine [tRNA(Phe)-imidazoG37] synthetase (radical SAM superfamily)